MARPISYTEKTTYDYNTYVAVVSPTLGRRKIKAGYLLNPPCKLIGSDLSTIVDSNGNNIIMQSGDGSSKRITALEETTEYADTDYVLICGNTYGIRKILATDLFGEVE